MTGFMILINDKSRYSFSDTHLLFQMIEQPPPDINSRAKIASIVNECKSLISKKGSKIIPKSPLITTNTTPLNLNISNLNTKYRLKYGSQFRNMLEPRDIVMEHEFNFNLVLELSKIQKEQEYVLIESEEGKILLKEIREFLVQAVSNIVSAGFNNLTEKKLEERESQEYAAKNIMLNIHSICKQTVQALVRLQEQKPILREKINVEEFREDLIIEVDDILHEILINLADSYPQAPVSGGSLRMRDGITEVNRVEDEENDLIFTSNIKIIDYLDKEKGIFGITTQIPRKDGDYTQFIMRVINAAIEGPRDNTDDSRERTVYQKFTEFNQHICYLTQQEKYQKLLGSIDQKENREKIDLICSKFNDILRNEEVDKQKGQKEMKKREEKEEIVVKEVKMEENIEEDKKKLEGQQQQSKIFKKETSSQSVDQFWGKAGEGIAEIRKNKKFSLGQKIPAAVKAFSRQEIARKQFSAKHSSIVRILTKWTGYLQEIFQNPEKMVRQRKYPFRNIKNELLNLDQKDEDGADKLIKQLNEEYSKVKEKFQDILRLGYKAMGKFMSDSSPQDFLSSVERYSETRTASSKINTVLATLLLQYANILIHHLLLAGQQIKSDQYRGQDLNLVVFRVSDLMRSKLQCSENSFIAMLKTMDLLENSEDMKNKFKLVRVKNKLDDPANNVMVNYLFMGKVQCQLQLSTQEPKSKEKNYYTYSHFVYELTRGMFGAVAGCATMISQLDSMITASNEIYYQEKKRTGRRPLKKRMRGRNGMAEGEGEEEKRSLATTGVKEPFFECCKCLKLITNQHTDRLFDQQKDRNKCYLCIVSDQGASKYLTNEAKSGLFSLGKEIKNYLPFDNLKSEKILVRFMETGETVSSVVFYDQEEMKTFSIELQQLQGGSEVNFSTLDYVDISSKIRGSVNNPETVVFLGCVFERDEFQKKDSHISAQKVNNFLKVFREFRQEKRVVKTIRYKAEIIKLMGKEEGTALDRVCRALVEKEKGIDLKYKKYRQLDPSNIKKIKATIKDLTKIPLIVRHCQNLEVLELSQNVKVIRKQQLPVSVRSLKISGRLEEIDISNLNQIISLDLNNNQITTFDLGENNSLTSLNLYNNKLTTFNLRENNSLTSLDLQDNKLTTFELRENNSLTSLNIFNNKLTTFDLRENNSLTSLDLMKNQITTFDLRENNSLTSLNLNFNKLTTFDLRENNSLTSLDLQDNKLTTFELRENNSLTSLNLFNNKLTTFDLRENNSLTSLNLTFNKLTTFDLRENNSLTSLDLQDNKLTTFELEENNSLTSLDLRSNKLTTFDLRENNSLTSLNLFNNKLTTFDLRENNSLTSLDLRTNELTTFDLRENNSLTSLDLRSNKLTTFDLRENNSLTSLDLRSNKLTTFDLRENNSLTSLNLTFNKLTTFDLRENNSLTSLDLMKNQITTFDLRENNSLTSLNLRTNELTTFDLRENNSLTSLDLRSNKLTTFDLRENNSLTSLDLQDNNLTTFDLRENNSLTSLNLFNNELTSFKVSEANSITEINLSQNKLIHFDIGSNNSLKCLMIEYNQLKSFDLGVNSSLEQLSIANNDLHSLQLHNNRNIKILSLQKNRNLPHISNLPLSLAEINVDKQAIIGYDFHLLTQLNKLNVYGEEVKREELKNLGEGVELKNIEESKSEESGKEGSKSEKFKSEKSKREESEIKEKNE